jgi:hypothetical protein
VEECAFLQRPAVIAAGDANIDLLNLLLADVVEDHPAFPAIVEHQVLMVAEARRPDVRQRARLIQKRIILGDAIGIAI